MLDISWGELFVVGAMGVAVTGRKDLPRACRVLGSQLGRVVGLLQGARARADQFAAHNELRQLQNELRSGLRELDHVKTELVVAASTQGMVGRTLGASTPSANRMASPAVRNTVSTSSSTTTSSSNADFQTFSVELPTTQTTAVAEPPQPEDPSSMTASLPIHELPPAVQSERAVMEDEWEKQGIGFRSRAEGERTNVATKGTTGMTGSELLETLLKQSLIFDQYDRVVGQQEAQLQERIDTIKEKRQSDGNTKKK